MYQYQWQLAKIIRHGETRVDRTGVGTKSLFGQIYMEFDLQEGFPLVTTRKIRFESVVDELLWFISGSTNINDLPERTRHWWRPWADENGAVGPMYGKQLRDSGGIDQLQETIDNIKLNPYSRRHVITLWNPSEIDMMALPPCHGIVIQFNVRGDEFLDCAMYVRSNDMILGCPVNIASYSLLTHMVSSLTAYKPGILHYVIGDAHIYMNHMEAAQEILNREAYPHPNLEIGPQSRIDDFESTDFNLWDYQYHPHMPLKIAV